MGAEKRASQPPFVLAPASSHVGTGPTEADTRTQDTIELPENAMTQPEGDWDLVYGELMTFANPGFDLLQITPGGSLTPVYINVKR